MKKKIAITLMALGAVMVVLGACLLGYNLYESEQARISAESLMKTIRQQVETVVPEQEDPFNDEMKIVNIDGYGYVGYLSIPVLDLDLPVMASCDLTRLKISPCRYYGSTKTDNLVIAAHNYKYHFGYLGDLAAEDLISFTDMTGTVTNYRVKAVSVISPTATDQVKDCGYDWVLYTCTYSGTKRIVVQCTYA